MNKIYSIYAFCILLATSVKAQNVNKFFKDVDLTNNSSVGLPLVKTFQSRTISINLEQLRNYLLTTPLEFTSQSASNINLLQLPMPDGSMMDFDMEESPMLESGLAAQFPDIKTYSGHGIKDKTASLKISITAKGFHAMILSAQGSFYIDPYNWQNTNYGIVYSKENFDPTSKPTMECKLGDISTQSLLQSIPQNAFATQPTIQFGDCQRRNFRLALAATGEYTTFHGGTVALALAAQVVSMNRVNGVYEKEFGVHMNIVANNNLIIYTNSGTDPYTNSNGSTMLSENQNNLTTVIGSANYDIGHVYSTGGGGIASLQSPCSATRKAQGVTGSGAPVGDPFDIDYVAHEMGHQFGANHTQNNSCNRNAATAVECGSGVTIMGYAGICAPNVASNSIDNFHSTSIIEITNFLSSASANCRTLQTVTNSSPTILTSTGNRTIPKSTPFMLTCTASDLDNDVMTYNWEQYDNQVSTQAPLSTNTGGPNFRCFSPNTNPTWYFPTLPVVVNNTVDQWQVLSSVARTMNFRLTVRDNHPGNGCTSSATSAITVDAVSGPFVVTSPTNTGVSYAGLTNQTITWNVAGTTAAPVNCANVDIFLSTDGGLTFPTQLATAQPNDGVQVVTIPNTATTQARIMVKANGNIFYDVSNNNFTITAAANPDYLLSSSPAVQSVCSGANATYTINTQSILGFSNSISLSASGFPGGSAVSFSPNPVTPGSNSTMTVTGLTTGSTSTITIIGNAAVAGTKTTTVDLTVLPAVGTFSLSTPANNSTGLSTQPILTWTASSGATSYDVQIATNSSFTTGLQTFSNIATNTYAISSSLSPNTQYFWKVLAKNNCSTGSYTSAFTFTTANIFCYTFNSTAVPVAISSVGTPTIFSQIQIPAAGNITDINLVNLAGTHTYIGDLSFSLVSPSGTTVALLSNPCLSQDNFNINFDDEATNNYASIPCPPTSGLFYQPQNPLSAYDGQNVNGIWQLNVADAFNTDGGSLNSWGLNVCYTPICNITATLTNTIPNCPNINTASINSAVAGGLAPYSYVWTNTSQTTANITGLSNNTYGVTVTDVQGCTVSSSNVIADAPSPATVITILPANASTLSANTVQFTWSAASNAVSYQIDISTSNTFVPLVTTASGITATTYTATFLSNTTYYWRVRGVNTCSNGSFSATKSFTTPNIFCTTFMSTDVPKSIGPNANTVTTSNLNIGVSGTIVDLNVVNMAGTHSYINDISFTLTSPAATVTNLLGNICNGEDNFDIGFDDASSNLYSSIPCPPISGLSYVPLSPLSIFNSQNINGNWQLKITDAFNTDGGNLNSWGLNVCYIPVCNATVSASPSTTICPNINTGTATVTTNGTTGNLTYQWSNSQTTPTATGLANGGYSVTITDAQGCTATTTFTISDPISASQVITLTPANNAIVNAYTATLTWNAATNASTYQVQLATDAAFSNIVQSASNLTTLSFLTSTLNINTTYFWRVRAANVCGNGSYSSTKQFSIPNIFCTTFMSTDVPKTISAVGANSVTSNLVVPISGSILDLNVVGLKGTHSYISDLVFKLNSPISTIDTILNSLCTNEDNFKINLDDESTSLYSSIPCPPTDSLTYKPFRALSMYDAAAVNGTWQLQVNDLFNTDGGSLTNWGLNVCYVVTCNMSASTTNTSTSCPSLSNGTATVTPINGVAPYTYLWSNSQTTSMSTNLGVGAYSVVVTDAQGCTASSSATISSTSNAPNQPSNFTTSTTTICSGGTYTYTVPTVANATSYTWAYSGNGASFTSTTNTVSITFNSSPTAGTLSVTANNSCGNSTARNISLSIGNNPIAPIVFANTNPLCSGTSTTLGSNVSTVDWFYNGSSTSFSSSSSPTVSNAGTYVAVNTTICGSATSNTITLGVTSLPAAPSVTSPVTYCTGATTIALVATGTSLKWYTVSTGGTASSTAPTPSASSSGTTPYYVSQTVNGCEGPRAQINVVVNQTPAAPTISIINGGVNPFCFGSSITLSSSSTTGNLWSTNATTQTVVASATASYSLTVTTNGCTSSQASLTVTEKPEIVAVINGVLNTCASSTNLSATQIIGYPVSVTYEWIFPDNSLTYGINKTATSSGTYSLNVYANDNCPFAQTSATVTVGNGVAPSITPSGPTTFCSGGNVTLTASTGTSYLWSTGATTQNITVSSSGDYNVTVTNGACSATTSNTAVTVNSIPTASISPSSGTITCSNSSILLTASGGGTYLWNNNATTATRTITAGGTYSVVVSNLGCSASASVTIGTNTTAPTAAITPSTGTITCSNTSINLVASGGGTYLWNNNSTSASRTVTSSGTYTVTVTGSNGCTATASSVIGTNTTPPTAAITPSTGTLTCSTTSINLVASGGSSYLWNDNSTLASRTVTSSGTYTVTVTGSNGCTATASSVIGTNTTAPTAAITPSTGTLTCSTTSINLVASGGGTYLWNDNSTSASRTITSGGTYSVTVTGTNGCTATASSVIGTNTTAPTAAITPSTGTLTCSTTSINLVASGGGTYLWNNNSTLASRTVTSSGTYTVTVTGSNGCTATASSVIGTNTTAPTAAITPSTGTLTCSTTSINLVASGGGTYLWNDNSASASRTVTSSGTYTVTVTGSNGCTATASSVIGTNTIPPTAAITPSTGTLTCSTTSINLVASGGGTYLWNDNSTSASRTITSGGTYSVTVTGTNGCTATTSSVIGTNTTAPTAAITPSTGTLTCSTTSINLVASGGGTYLWNNNSTLASRTVTSSGTYTVTVTGSNGCTATASSVIGTNTTAPTAAITPSTGTLTCSTTSINLVASGGGTYLWNDNSTNATRTVTSGGNYSVVVTGSNGCTATASSVIGTNITAPTAAITPSTGTLTCSTTSINLVASGGGTYLWNNNSTSASRTVTSGGTYTVTVTGSNGCTATASSVIGINTTPPTAAITPSTGTLTCSTTSINLVASGGGTYLWNNNSTSALRTVTSGGTYTVTVTGSNGCTATASSVIGTNITAPNATISAPSTSCVNNIINLSVANAGVGATYTWTGGNGIINSNSNSTTATPTTNGSISYGVQIVASNGCSATATTTINVSNTATWYQDFDGDGFGNPAITQSSCIQPNGYVSNNTDCDDNNFNVNSVPTAAAISAQGNTSFCAGGSVNLTGNNGGVWSTGSTLSSITVTQAGTYSVTSSNSCGSVTSNTIAVTVNALPTAATISAQGNTSFCAGGSVTLSGNIGGVWSSGGTQATISVTTSGTYSVTTTNSCGSVTSNTIAVTVNANPTPTIVGDANFCPNSNTTLATSQSYTSYMWSNLSTTASINVTAANTYSVNVIDANGCSGTTSVTVNSCGGVGPQGSFPASQCGYITNVPTGYMFCNVTIGASGYITKFYNVGSNTVYAQKTITTNSVTFTGLTPALLPGAQYDVTVTPILALGPIGIESPKCRIGIIQTQTPSAIATSSLSNPACVSNPTLATVLTSTATIKCTSVPQASTFQFKFENVANSSNVVLAFQSGARTRTLAPLNLTPGATYGVSVRATVTGVQASSFGPVCYIKIAGGNKEAIETVKIEDLEFKISVTPNPVVDDATINITTSKNELVNVTITDVMGKVVYTNKVATNSQFIIHNLELRSGIYFLIATLQSGERKTIKIVKD